MTVGPEVMDAYHKMEKLEHTARVMLAAQLQGPVTPLPPGGGGEAAASGGEV